MLAWRQCLPHDVKAVYYHPMRVILDPRDGIPFPSIDINGNKWCALVGDSLADGIAGFGDTPDEALAAFKQAWTAASQADRDRATESVTLRWSRPD